MAVSAVVFSLPSSASPRLRDPKVVLCNTSPRAPDPFPPLFQERKKRKAQTNLLRHPRVHRIPPRPLIPPIRVPLQRARDGVALPVLAVLSHAVHEHGDGHEADGQVEGGAEALGRGGWVVGVRVGVGCLRGV